MGLFQSIKNIFTKKETTTTQTIAPKVITPPKSSQPYVPSNYVPPTITPTQAEQYRKEEQAVYTSRGYHGGSSYNVPYGATQEEIQQASKTAEIIPTSQTGRQEYVKTEQNRLQAQKAAVQTSPVTNQVIQPSSVSSSQYTGAPPEKYSRPLGSAIKESFTNIFNFGIIGRQGLGSYFDQIFYKPYEYVGKPQAYSNVSNYNLQNWRGTEFGYGLSEEQKNIYRPAGYQTITYFQKGEEQKAALFKEAGLKYTGEPVSLIPTRVGEQISGELAPKYEAGLQVDIEKLREKYQGNVNRRELSVEEATAAFKLEAGSLATVANSQFQQEFAKTYSSRMSGISGFDQKIASVEAYQSKIFEPPAYPIIRTAGKVLETGAIIGATAFGGSGLTYAASVYLGARTATEGIKYAGAFENLSTSQKVLGGVGLAAGAAATFYTFNLGTTRFYSEWRSIKYEDLAKTPARIRGSEVFKNEDVTVYATKSIRQSGANTAITKQVTQVYQTGADRVGFYGKGITRTTIYDPQYEKFITTTTNFQVGGNIPNIKEGVAFGSGGLKVTSEDYFGGLGRAKIITGENVKDISFIGAAKDQGQFYRVAGGTSPQRAFSGKITEGVSYYSTAIRGRFDSAGIINKLQDQGVSNLIVTAGKKSSQAYFNQLYGVSGATALQTTSQVQAANLIDLSAVASPSATSTITSQAASQATRFKFTSPSQIQESSSKNLVYTLPVLSQLMPQGNGESQAVGAISASVFADLSRSSESTRFVPAQANIPVLATLTRQGLKLRQGTLTPFAPSIPNYFATPEFTGGGTAGFFYFDLGGLDLGLPSTILRGGKRKTGYTPSFSALVFNLKGAYSGATTLSKSGIDFRPITKGFNFQTGIGGLGSIRKISIKRR